MLRTVLLAVCFCALALPCAEARPAHGRGNPGHQDGCSQPEMRSCDSSGIENRSASPKTGKKTNKYGHSSSASGGFGITRHRPRAWCGWWLSRHLGMHDRRLWLARNWAGVGRHSHGPAIGAIVVWRHHVGIITGRTDRGWVVKSGNDGNAVRERVRSVAGAIAFRWP